MRDSEVEKLRVQQPRKQNLRESQTRTSACTGTRLGAGLTKKHHPPRPVMLVVLHPSPPAMIKLYKRTESQTLYWEAWGAGNRAVTIHWGTLGETGQNKNVGIPTGETADTVIDRERKEPRSNGYEEVDADDHSQIVVQFKTKDTWGDTGDLDKRHKVEDILNECLGWTGNGHCDGGDIGSGTINTFSFVVDPQLATDAIVAALKKNKMIDGAIIAVNKEDEYKVLWPKDFDDEFSIL